VLLIVGLSGPAVSLIIYLWGSTLNHLLARKVAPRVASADAADFIRAAQGLPASSAPPRSRRRER
jgi:hypothetical protein